jgi:HSP20 family protein
MSLMKRERHMAWPLDMMWSEDRIDRVFRDMFRNVLADSPLEWPFEGRNAMRVEEFLEDGACVIRAELPGLDPEKDVDISVTDGVLHLKAEREERSEDNRPDAYRTEFHYGSLERFVRLPDGVSMDDVKATYKDGILEIRVPVPPAEIEPKPVAKIPVTRG